MLEDYRPLHVNNVVRELNNSTFAAAFGDVKLVFSNGEVTHHFLLVPQSPFFLSLHPPSTPSPSTPSPSLLLPEASIYSGDSLLQESPLHHQPRLETPATAQA